MSSTAAIWSAIAATFAALSSFLIFWTPRTNLLESVRPELILTGWDRSTNFTGDNSIETISFETIRNVGRGAALHINLHAAEKNEDRFTAILPSKRLPILAANEEEEFRGEIRVFWDNVDADDPSRKSLGISIETLCWDSKGMRHETRYVLMVVMSPEKMLLPDAVAPGVSLHSRTTKVRPVWYLKQRARALRIADWVRNISRNLKKRLVR